MLETEVKCIENCWRGTKTTSYGPAFSFSLPARHGITLNIRAEYEEKRNQGEKYTMKHVTITKCFKYREMTPTGVFGGFSGAKSHTSGSTILWSREVPGPNHVIDKEGPTQSTYKVSVDGSGEMKAFKKFKVKQSFTAGGEVSFTKPKVGPMKMDIHSKLFIKFTLGKEWCFQGWPGVGVIGVSLDVEAALAFQKMLIEATGSGTFTGHIAAKMKVPKSAWDLVVGSCQCPGDDCSSVAGARAWGKIEIKLSPFDCFRDIKMSITGEVGYELNVGSLSVYHKFDFELMKPRVLDKLRCIY